MDTVTYVLSKKYTDDTVNGMGALKGAAATIKSIDKADGVSTVTFEWVAADGTTQTSTMQVADGVDGEKGLSIKNAEINEDGHLIVTYDDDTVKDAGVMPKQPLAIDPDKTNAIQQRAEGLYVNPSAVDLDPREDNMITDDGDGLYVPQVDGVKISPKDNNIISKEEDGSLFSLPFVEISKEEYDALPADVKNKKDKIYLVEEDAPEGPSSLGGLRFGVNENGDYGYYKIGSNVLTPFVTASGTYGAPKTHNTAVGVASGVYGVATFEEEVQ